jgi:threonine/homoserine/homoserine lactone efflux protein
LVWIFFLALVPQGLQPPGPQLDDVAFLVVAVFFGFISLLGFDFVGLGAQGQPEQEAHPDISGTPYINN